VGVGLDDRSACTGCEVDRYYSHRARRDVGRQVMAVWRTASPAGGAV
jgi:copper oxidase (laccase) domain-containing protein